MNSFERAGTYRGLYHVLQGRLAPLENMGPETLTIDALLARVAMKPLATLNRPILKTVDVVTKQQTVSFKERTDVTAVPAMGVVAETMTSLVLAGEALRKFCGDSLEELLRNRDGYLANLR